MTVPGARLLWLLALFTLPAVLAGLALLWVGPPAPAAPAAPAPGAPPATAAAPPSAPPATAAPVVATDPPPAQPPDPVRAELTRVLAAEPIRFSPDSAVLVGPPAETVQRVAQLLLQGPAEQVLVEGHVADTPGGPDVAQRLADKRAAVVAEALVAAGVPAERITTRGVGATRPLATPEESRRVEITIG
ncbi:OmpA family protein [Pseudonocardia cypriaca]|uniref:OmpA family protein n=1 Tax=Pseudonocardia cypriaca TaxID=882449 RepID=UPI00114E74F1|nr:OmpA family protein [Pseudonocardia cypriaca]